LLTRELGTDEAMNEEKEFQKNLEPVKGTSLWRDAWKRLLKNKLAVLGMIVLCFIIVAALGGPPIIKALTGYSYDFIPPDKSLVNSFPPSGKHPMGTDTAGRDMLARVLIGGRISLLVGLISTVVSLLIGISYGATAGYFGGKVDNFMMRIVDILYAIPHMIIVIILLSFFSGDSKLVKFVPKIMYPLIFLTLFVAVAAALSVLADLVLNRLLSLRVSKNPIIFGIVLLLSLLGIFLNVPNRIQTAMGQNRQVEQLMLLFMALGAVSWLTMARIVRGQVMSLKNQEFVLAARATGVTTPGIIFRHLVPNTLGPVIVYATLTIPSVMLQEAFLSFLGLGVQAPLSSWGSLASEGIRNLAFYPWQLIFPGVTMALTLFSLNFLGDGLRDALDPQMRKD